MKFFRSIFLVGFILGLSQTGLAQYGGGGGGWRFGASVGIVNSGQDDMNTLIERADNAVNISTSQFSNAWEASGYIGYRFDLLELQLRPSYFWQTEEGSGGGNNFNYKVNTVTVFPIVRFYLLENDFVSFFTNVGIGFGFANGSIKEGPDEVDFSGNDLGYMAGLGANFCFLGGSHCLVVEGNLRFLSVERMLADNVSGDFSDGNPYADTLSQAQKNEEVELDNKDFGLTMSGIMGTVGYLFRF